MGTGLSVIFCTQLGIGSSPELSYVQLCMEANGLGCYQELIRQSVVESHLTEHRSPVSCVLRLAWCGSFLYSLHFHVILEASLVNDAILLQQNTPYLFPRTRFWTTQHPDNRELPRAPEG